MLQPQTPKKAVNQEKVMSPHWKRRDGGTGQEREIACARGGGRRSARVETSTKRILFMAVHCAEQHFQVARHRTTIRPGATCTEPSCVHVAMERLAIPDWPSARRRRCHEPACRLKQLSILSLARTVGGIGTETVNRVAQERTHRTDPWSSDTSAKGTERGKATMFSCCRSRTDCRIGPGTKSGCCYCCCYSRRICCFCSTRTMVYTVFTTASPNLLDGYATEKNLIALCHHVR